MTALEPSRMAMHADDVIVGRKTDVFTTLRHGLAEEKSLGREGVSGDVAAAGNHMPVRQPPGSPPGSSPLRGEHRDARDPTCGTNASAERPCPAPPYGITPPPGTLPGCPPDAGARQCTGYRIPSG
jgi:hypothetical protein